MVDIDFDALAQLPNLLENGDFTAGNDNSPSRIPGWEQSHRNRQYGGWYWLDYENRGMGTPTFCLDLNQSISAASHVIQQDIPYVEGHRYVLIARQHVDHPSAVDRGAIQMAFMRANGVAGQVRYLNATRPGVPHRSAVISLPDSQAISLRIRIGGIFQANSLQGSRWWIGDVRVVDLTAAGMDGLPETSATIEEQVDVWNITGPDDAGVDAFTRDWWDRLPAHVRRADVAQRPYPVPLLRFLDGVGSHAGSVRRYTWDLWSGVALAPETAPDSLLPWISYLLGLHASQRARGVGRLREVLSAHMAGGIHAVGTRGHIAEIVKPFLEPGAGVLIRASTWAVNTLVIMVDPSDVPDEDYDLLMRRVRASGAVPAGHALLVQDLRATWDEWEAVAGDTWEEKERNIPTWSESDTAGVEML